jgi:amino acid adenylation domain-containing protein
MAWLSRLQRDQAAQRQFEHCSLIDVQGWSDVPRGVALFQSVFVFENFPAATRFRDAESATLFDDVQGSSERIGYPLAIHVEPRSEISIKFTYDCARFHGAAIRSLLAHYVHALDAIAAQPARTLGSIPVLTTAEGEVLSRWNATDGGYAADAWVTRRFEQRARSTPGAVALDVDGHRVTYDDLNRRANQLAHHLMASGVGPETAVGLFVERSPEMLVGMLAILKAGGAYVPLDPAYPPERLVTSIDDVGIALLLTQAAHLDAIPWYVQQERGLQVLTIDAEEAFATYASDDPAPRISGAHAAYVIATSGSTGVPNAVVVSHESLARSTAARDAFYGTPGTVLLLPSFAFDAFVGGAFWTLCGGGTLVLPGREFRGDPAEVIERIVTTGATYAMIPPAIYGQVLDQATGTDLASLVTVVVGGEASPASLTVQHARMLPGTRLVNEYGPTEATIWSTAFVCPAWQAADGPVPIGGPVGNVKLYVIDDHLQRVPIGVIGELLIGGAGVARGYANRAALTAERFLPDPFGSIPGARVYRTGDRVRFRPDGCLEFLGRRDHQVKLRGHRIELGEIETALLACEGVREAVVTVREDSPGDRRLIAHVVADGEAVPETLRRMLARKLPEYMVPSAVVILRALPRTPAGKLDRSALPPPEVTPAPALASSTARTPTEEIVAGLFAETLQLPSVGIDGHFFDLGGHSLLATQTIAGVRETFGVELSVRSLFEAPTVAAFAQVIDGAQHDQRGLSRPAVVPVPRDQALPLSFAQQRLWFIDQLEPDSSAYNCSGALRLTGSLRIDVLTRTLTEIVRRHEMLRTTFASVDGRPVQVVHSPFALPLPVTRVHAATGDERESEVRRLFQEEARARFDLQRGPLARVRLLSLGADDHVLLFTLHHIAADGWSMAWLVREVGAIYTAFLEGKPSPLEPLAVQYADYAIWQRGWLQGSILERELEYWRRQLAGCSGVSVLAAGHPRSAVAAYRGAEARFAISSELTATLVAMSRREGVTLFMTLFAAFQVLLHRRTGVDDISVGTVVSGRTASALEPLIGCFINNLVLRTNLSGNPTFREAVARVREVALGAFVHQDVPFERLVEELHPVRAPGETPFFQIAFGVQNAPVRALTLPGVTVTPVSVHANAARLDLAVWLGEDENGGMRGSCTYNADLFEATTVATLFQQFTALLASAVANPDTRLDALDLITDDDRRSAAEEEQRFDETIATSLMRAGRRAVQFG